jgi:hypothetical protein
VLFHDFDRFLAEYESCFEKEHGFLRPVIKEVVELGMDPGKERLVTFSRRLGIPSLPAAS